MNTVHCKQRNTNRSSRARGTALVLVVVLLALLAILGTTFVITSRIERVAAGNVVAAGELDQAIDSVVEVIKSTLAEDLWGRPEDATSNQSTTMNKLRLLGLPCADNGSTDVATASRYNNIAIHSNTHMYFVNEPWDAPWTQLNASPTVTTSFSYWDGTAWGTVNWAAEGDPWLASTEMNGGVWPRVSDIFRVRFTDAWPADFDNVPDSNLSAQDQAEKYADADGDGTLDAVWLYQRGFFNEYPNSTYHTATYADIDRNGVAATGTGFCGLVTDLPFKTGDPNTTYRMAVRIVDTCGMVNVNTAWKRPTEPQEFTGDDFPGHLLSGVNLYDANLVGSDFSPLPGRPADNATLTNLASYQEKYIFRIEHPWGSNGLDIDNPPFSGFCPLDLSDEIALRTYPDTIDNTTLVGLFPALATTQALKPRLTTYSFSRNLRRTLATGNGALWDIDDTSGAGLQNVTGRTSANRNGFPRKKNFDLALKIWRDVNIPAISYRPRQDEMTAEMLSGDPGSVHLTADAEFISALYASFWNAYPSGATRASDASHRTAQFLVNLMDYFDDDFLPTRYSVSEINQRIFGTTSTQRVLPDWDANTYGQYVYGNEPHLVISEVYVYQSNEDTDNRYYAIELYNPWHRLGTGDPISLPTVGTKIFIRVMDSTNHEKLAPVPLPIAQVAEGQTLLLGSSNKHPRNTEVGSVTVPGLTLASGDKIILGHELGPSNGDWAPVDQFTVGDIETAPAPPSQPSDPRSYNETNFSRYTATNFTNEIANPSTPKLPQMCDWPALVDRSERTFTATTLLPEPEEAVTPIGSLAGLNGGEPLPFAPFSIPYKVKIGNALADETIPNPEDIQKVWFVGAELKTTGVPPTQQEIYSLPAQMVADNQGREEDLRMAFDNAFGQWFMEFFTLLSRDDDGVNQMDPSRGADCLDEIRLPGLININTAPAAVLQALHPYIDSSATAIIDGRPYASVCAVLPKISQPPGTDLGTQGVTNDLEEKQLGWTRAANLMTVRSDTFVAYILVEKLDRQGHVLNRRREMVLFDRSWCNQPPLVWNDEWVPNPNYVAPKVVARQVVE